MGRGDIKTRKGKITAGSFGKARPKRTAKVAAPVAESTPAPAAKKAAKK